MQNINKFVLNNAFCYYESIKCTVCFIKEEESKLVVYSRFSWPLSIHPPFLQTLMPPKIHFWAIFHKSFSLTAVNYGVRKFKH